MKRPSIIGLYANVIVYRRLAPGVFRELDAKNPRLPGGNREHRYHQWFTQDIGHPKLKEQIAGIMTIMRIAVS